MIERFQTRELLRALAQFPVVALLGPRQVGKTTLARELVQRAGKPATYLDLELDSDRAKLDEAELYLRPQAGRLTILDEVQRRPELFPLLRALIDVRIRAGERAGHFLVLGSASVELLRQSSESLAGRIATFELRPLALREVANTSADFVERLWLRGGFPLSYLAPDERASWDWRGAFLATYLERDVPQLGPRLPAELMRRFLALLAHGQGDALNMAKLATNLGVSGQSVRRYVDLFTDLFLVRQLEPWTGDSKKRLVRVPKVYARDCGLTHRLAGVRDMDTLLGHPLVGRRSQHHRGGQGRRDQGHLERARKQQSGGFDDGLAVSASARAMRALLLRRLATALPTLAAVLILSFVLMRLAPGGPFDGERALDPETRAALTSAYGLDQPLPTQIALYVGRIAHGDFGPSLVYRDFTVTDLVRQGLPVSLTLGALAMLLALALGLGIALLAATRPGGQRDKALMLGMTLLTALPSFVTAPLLVLAFALLLGLLPVSGWGSPANLVLPVTALALPVAGAIAKLARAGLADVLAQDHIRTARARGLSPLRILIVHALRPALIPVASYAGPAAAGLLTGAVVIETVFALPGLGRYFVQGALNRDYTLVMGVVILYATLIIVLNLIADVMYRILDPRVRLG